jgi:hypothetical protein
MEKVSDVFLEELVEAAGVEPFIPLKTRKLSIRHGRKGPKGPECRIDCTTIVRRAISRFSYGCETEGKENRSFAWSIAYPIAL